jgi:hypothetical protein
MKRIKIMSVVLAIIFVVLTSFNSNNNFLTHNTTNGWFYRWFEYDGWGDPLDPASYRPLIIQPSCSSDVSLCAVYAESEFLLLSPTCESLFELAINSDFFQTPYSGEGEVRLKAY